MSVVRVSWPSARTCFGIVMAGLLSMPGCVTPKPVLPQAPAKPPPSFGFGNPDAMTKRVQELSKGADDLSANAKQLPGKDAAEHVKIIQRVFTDLLQTLPLLANTTDDASLRQLLARIQESRAQLANGTPEMKVDPVIENGLRAAATALLGIAQGEDYKDADPGLEIGKSLDTLSGRLNRLEQVHNASLHRIDVAEVVEQTSRVISGLAATLGRHLAASKPAAPASEPASPTSQPAAPTSKPAGPSSQPSSTALDGK